MADRRRQLSRKTAYDELVNEVNHHCRLRGMDAVIRAAEDLERAAILEAVAPVISVLMEAIKIGRPRWISAEKTCAAIDMLRKLGGGT